MMIFRRFLLLLHSTILITALFLSYPALAATAEEVKANLAYYYSLRGPFDKISAEHKAASGKAIAAYNELRAALNAGKDKNIIAALRAKYNQLGAETAKIFAEMARQQKEIGRAWAVYVESKKLLANAANNTAPPLGNSTPVVNVPPVTKSLLPTKIVDNVTVVDFSALPAEANDSKITLAPEANRLLIHLPVYNEASVESFRKDLKARLLALKDKEPEYFNDLMKRADSKIGTYYAETGYSKLYKAVVYDDVKYINEYIDTYLIPVISTAGSANDMRQRLATALWGYAAFKSYVSPEKRKQIADLYYENCKHQIGYGDKAAIYRWSDTDHTQAILLGNQIMAIMTMDENPKAVNCVMGMTAPKGQVGFIGGTRYNDGGFNIHIKHIIDNSEGGEHIVQSTDYGPNDNQILAIGIITLRMITGDSKAYPEADNYFKSVLKQNLYTQLGTSTIFGLGDDERQGRNLIRYPQVDTSSIQRTERDIDRILLYFVRNDSEIGPKYYQKLLDYNKQNGRMAYTAYSMGPIGYDPRMKTDDWRNMPLGHVAPGVGLLTAREKGPFETSAVARFAAYQNMDYDHGVKEASSPYLYAFGRHILSEVTSYTSHSGVYHRKGQSFLINGQPSMRLRAKPEWVFEDNVSAMVARTGGSLYPKGHYQAPPVFLGKHIEDVSASARLMAFFPTPEGGMTQPIIFDFVRVRDVKDAHDLVHYERYRPIDKVTMDDSKDVLESINNINDIIFKDIRVSGNEVIATTEDNKLLKISMLMPPMDDTNIDIIDVEQTYGKVAHVDQMGKRIIWGTSKLKPVNHMLKVISVNDAQKSKIKVSTLKETESDIIVRVERTNIPDLVVQLGLQEAEGGLKVTPITKADISNLGINLMDLSKEITAYKIVF